MLFVSLTEGVTIVTRSQGEKISTAMIGNSFQVFAQILFFSNLAVNQNLLTRLCKEVESTRGLRFQVSELL